LNPMQAKEVIVNLDRPRNFRFSWKAVDFITDRYESIGEALLLIATISDNPMTLTKKSLQAMFDLFTALLIDDDPEITSDRVRELIPFDRMGEFAPLVLKAINDDAVQHKEEGQENQGE